MKTKILIPILMIASVLSLNCNNITFKETADYTDDPTKYKYFTIYVTEKDDSVFTKVQDEMEIEPHLSSYMLVVNITNNDSNQHYIVFGAETDDTKIVINFYSLSKQTRQKLLNWAGPNKRDNQDINGPDKNIRNV